MMTRDEALTKLWDGGQLHELAEAIGVVVSDPTSSPEDILLGLHYKGFVAEQAALALYTRTNRPVPNDRAKLSFEFQDWVRWISTNMTIGSDDSKRRFPEIGLEDVKLDSLELRPVHEYIARGLSRKERLIVILYYFEGLTFDEIAEALDISVANVESCHRSILSRLREALASKGSATAKLFRDLMNTN